MANALAREGSTTEALSADAQEVALRLMLEEARQLAAQSRLIALNAAFESAGARNEEAATAEMDALGGSAGRTAAEMDRVVATVELLLQQIQSASALSGPL